MIHTRTEIEERLQVLYPGFQICVQVSAVNMLHRSALQGSHVEKSILIEVIWGFCMVLCFQVLLCGRSKRDLVGRLCAVYLTSQLHVFITHIVFFQRGIHGARGALLRAQVVCCVLRWDGVTEVEPPRNLGRNREPHHLTPIQRVLTFTMAIIKCRVSYSDCLNASLLSFRP